MRHSLSTYIDFRTPGVSTFSATLLALVIFFIYSTGYALLVFIQFTPLQIASVGLTCASLLIALTALFMRPSLMGIDTGPLRINAKTLSASLFITFVLIMFSHSTGTTFSAYVRTFPLLETELGLGWHQDTTFHVSLIQSILNFGYPSIAQHGHPLTAYHVLSHYTDALILFITQLDPYDSYGLLFHYKIFLFLSSILLTVTTMTRDNGWITYLASFVLLAPCVMGTWHAIGSHGLWMASLVMLLSAPYVFSRLNQNSDLSICQLFALLLIIISIALAKISSGFMYGALLGAFIFSKQPRHLTTYIFGAALLIFFYLYGNLFFSRLNNISGSLDLSTIGLVDFYTYITATKITAGQSSLFSHMPAILTCTAILITLKFSTQQLPFRHPIVAATVAVLALYFITQTNKSLVPSDIWYFQYGAISGLILLTFATILQYKSQLAVNGQNKEAAPSTYARGLSIAGVACLALLTKYTVLANFNIFNLGPESIRQKIAYANSNPFSSINKKLAPEEQLTILTDSNKKEAALAKLSTSRPLEALRDDIARIQEANGLRSNRTALLLSSEYFGNQLTLFEGLPWARGLLIYAVTGTQLLYGVTSLRRGYGYTPYYKPYTPLSTQLIAEHRTCVENKNIDAIIIQTTQFQASVIDCRNAQ